MNKSLLLAFSLLLFPFGSARAQEPYVAGEVIVQLRAGTGNLERDDAIGRVHGRIREHVLTRSMRERGAPGFLVVKTDLTVEDAVLRLRGHRSVEFAEPNFHCEALETANDTYYTAGSLWGMYGDDKPSGSGPTGTTNAFGSQAEKAWAAGQVGSRDVFVGIVDEGVQLSHPDLTANVWTNPYDPADGVDNDGNGYVDDVHGWDFLNNDNSVYDGLDDDHATHVAGTIGGVGGNLQGVAGACWRVTMIPVKFLGADGGPVSAAVKALDYVTNLKARHGMRIVATNNSWSTTSYSRALNDAVLRAARQDILTIAAAGNSALDNDTSGVWPANFDTTKATASERAATYDAVISVAAIDRYGALASFSDYGATSVDLGAPGVGIISTLPSNTYGSYSGTSMATPHVTGAVALLAAAEPDATASELKELVIASTIPTSSLQGRTTTGGRLNVGEGFALFHDVAVTSLSVPTSVTQGATAMLHVTATNQGTTSESFTISMVDTPPAGGKAGIVSSPRSVVLAAGASTTVDFTWSTTGATVGSHVLAATASGVAGDADTTNNTMTRASTITVGAVVVSSIDPYGMRTRTTIPVTVRGTGFAQGATLTFTNGGGSAPQASGIVVSANGTTLTAKVYAPPNGKMTHVWDVVVRNPNGQSGVKARVFAVTR